MPQRRGRKRAVPRVIADGQFYGLGPEVEDAISGWLFPRSWMVKQCGGLVSRADKDGSYDYVDGRFDRGCPGGRTAPPILSIEATTPTCIEGSSTGLFTISRDGDLSQELSVNLVIAGTATNGTDYTTISTTVTLPAGSSSVTITVTPTNDGSTEGDETVIVRLDPPVSHSNYYIDVVSAEATVTISDPEAPATIEWLLRYEFEDTPGVLVNEGTLGTDYNFSEDAICLG